MYLIDIQKTDNSMNFVVYAEDNQTLKDIIDFTEDRDDLAIVCIKTETLYLGIEGLRDALGEK
jgi:hypothetical protein